MDNERKNVIKIWKGFSSEVDKPKQKPDFTIIDQIAKFFSPGTFYYYVFNFSTFKMEYVSNSYQAITGLNPKDFSSEIWLETVFSEDVSKVRKCEKTAVEFLLDFLSPEEMLRYKVSYTYRMKGADGKYFNNLHQSMALTLTENNSIGHVLCTETNIDHLIKSPVETVSFLDLDFKKNYINIDLDNPVFTQETQNPNSLTNQELKIVGLISYGHSNNEISQMLNISPHTIRKHRENALAKFSKKNMTALISDLIRKGIL